MSTIILFNKPFNVLSQFSDDQGRDTLKNYLPDYEDVYPAGRLDFDSEGLLILTNNGKLQHQISHPNNKKAKTYWVQIEGSPRQDDLLPLIEGITLSDGPCKPAIAKLIAEPSGLWPRNPPVRERAKIPTKWLELTITEGRNRQVRRMTAAIGFPTLRLIRVKIGDWSLQTLQPGDFNKLIVHAPMPNNKGNKSSYKSKNVTKRHTTKSSRRL